MKKLTPVSWAALQDCLDISTANAGAKGVSGDMDVFSCDLGVLICDLGFYEV